MLAAALTVHPAEAQNLRSFVSGHGVDGNSCNLAAPCRSFTFAVTKTSPGGEIVVLDPSRLWRSDDRQVDQHR